MKKDFESRFMPDVKFFMPNELQKQWCEIFYDKKETKYQLPFWSTSKDGNSIFYNGTYYADFRKLSCIEVSAYEAIPELIPEGMRYNKELDKLVPDAISAADEYCSGIKVEFEKVVDYTEKNHRSYNIGSSDYATMKIQPWDIWKDWKLDPWDADIIKRISRTKEIPGKTFEEARIEDYEKIKHICDEKIYQLKKKLNVK